MADGFRPGGLLDWLAAPRADRGVRFAEPERGWAYESYASLAGRVAEAAAFVLDAGIRRNDVVALLIGDSRDFLAAFLGTLHAGGTPCPVVPPGYFRDPDDYVTHAAGIFDAARPRLAITDATLRPVVERAVARAQARTGVVAFAGAGERHGPGVSARADLACCSSPRARRVARAASA